MKSHACPCCGFVPCALSDALAPRREAFIAGWLASVHNAPPRYQEGEGGRWSTSEYTGTTSPRPPSGSSVTAPRPPRSPPTRTDLTRFAIRVGEVTP